MQASPGIDRRTMVIVLVLMVGGLAAIFDSTIVSIGLRTLADALSVPVSTIQWVSTGYLLALGVAIPVVGWAQARLGGKTLWLVALGVFGVASVACSLAWDAPSLIAFRVVQGTGGGLMLPLMATLAVQQLPEGAGLGRLMALVSLPVALGPILGPTIGGLILNWLDWRWIFWVNVPLCAIGIALAWQFLPRDAPRGRPRLDWLGLLLATPGLAGILYGLSGVVKDGGAGRLDVWLTTAIGVALVAAFVVVELGRPADALVDVGLLRHRPVASASAVLFLSGAALYGSMLLLPLYFQVVRGTDVLTAALLLVPQGVGALLSRTLAGRLTDALGARVVAMICFAVVGLATVPFALADTTTATWWLLAVLFVRGLGTGAVMIPVMSVGYVGLARDQVPHASIITRLAQQVGGAFGTAVLAVILEAAAAGAVDTAGYAFAFDTALWWAVGFTVVAVAVCLVLPSAQRTPLPVPGPSAEPA